MKKNTLMFSALLVSISVFGYANTVFEKTSTYGSDTYSSALPSPSPNAHDDTAEVIKNSSANKIDVLINDSFGVLGPHPGSALLVNAVSNAGGHMIIDYNGTPNDPMDDKINYYPPAGFIGLDIFSYTIVAANGSTDTSVVRVLVVDGTDNTPIAVDDTITLLEDSSEIIAVLSNDSFGGDGPSRTAIAITAPPAHGTATVDTNDTPADPTDDSIVFEGALDYYGSDVFTYEICDSDGDCDTAVVSLTISNQDDLPVAVDDTIAIMEDSSEIIAVLSNDSFGGDGPSRTAITITSPPAQGTATVDMNDTPSDPTDDSIVYVGAPDYYGTDVFTYEICDSDGDCDTAVVSLTISNQDDAPVAVDDTITLLEDSSERIAVLSNDSFGGDGPSNTAITITSLPTQGTATVDTNGTPADPTDDNIVYEGASDYYGSDVFTYEICDSDGDCDTAVVSLTISNQDDLPVAVDDTIAIMEDSSEIIAVLSNDSFGGDGPSRTAITITSPPAQGIATVDMNDTPSDPTDDSIVFVGAPDYYGSDVFTYEICDSDGDCDTAVVSLTISNQDDAPVAVDDTITLLEDSSERIAVLSNDSFGGDGPSNTAITITSPPTQGTATVDTNDTPADPTDDSIVYEGASDYYGSDVFTYEICDSDGDCDTAVVSLSISNQDDVPVAVDDTITMLEDSSEIIAVLSNDSFGGDGPSRTAITITSPPAQGTATVDTNDTPSDPTDDSIVYEGAPDYYGSDVFTYQICDSDGDCDTAQVSLTISDVADLTGNLHLTKEGEYVDTNMDCIINVGDHINYTFVVENNGDLDLKNIVLIDLLAGVDVTGDPIDLAVGDTDNFTYTARYSLTEQDVIAQQVVNQATVMGEDSNGIIIMDDSDDPSDTTDIDSDQDGDPEDPTIVILKDPEGVIIYESFSPNGDGTNEEFVIKRLKKYPENNLQIFNRWGVKVFDKDQYEQQGVSRFTGFSDGRITIERGESLPVGTYYYTLSYVDSAKRSQTKSGSFYLVR